jgi:hypothetical protein
MRGNRCFVAPEWVSVANIFGSRLETFGESTGRFEI